MRQEFEMTDEELREILDASQPVPYLIIGGHAPESPQECANRAWQRLGEKRGFIWDSAQPVSGKGQRFFTAEFKT